LITKKFLKASFIYTLAGALPMASAIILLPFYIYYLPTDVYGALSLYLAFSLFVQIIVTYSFDSSAYIHYHDYKGDPAKLSSFISSVFIFMLLIGTGVGLVLVALGDFLFTQIFDDPKISFYPFGVISVLIGIFQALNKVYNSILQSSEKQVMYLWSNVLYFLFVGVITVAGLYFFPKTLIGPIGGRLVAGIIIASWTLYRVYKAFGYDFNYHLLKSTFGFNHYIFIYQIQQWVINYFDRFLLLFFLPLSTIGVYDFAVKCLIAVEFVMNGLHTSFYPKVVSTITAQTIKGSTQELNRYYYGLVAIIMIAVSSGIFILPIAIDFLINNQGYQEAIPYLPYIAVTYLLKTIKYYFAIPYGVLKHTKPLPLISLFVSALKIALMLLFVRQFEIYGIIAAALISLVIEIWLLKYVLTDKFNFQFNPFKLIITPALLLGLVVLIEPFIPQNLKVYVHLFYLIITGVSLLWTYRNDLNLFKVSKFFN
jgi:O-antigen/teichoic acid export membrane protein